MRLFLAFAALPLLGAAPPADKSSASSRLTTPIINLQTTAQNCPDTPMSRARQLGKRPPVRKLDELPSAQAYAAVDRQIDHCPAPMLLSEARR